MRAILIAPFAAFVRLPREPRLLLISALIFIAGALGYLYWPAPNPDLKLITHVFLHGENCVLLQIINKTDDDFQIRGPELVSPTILSRVETPDGWEEKAVPVSWKYSHLAWWMPVSPTISNFLSPGVTVMRPGDSARIAIPYPLRNGAATQHPFKVGIRTLRLPGGMIEDLKIRLSRRVTWAPAEPTEVYLWSDSITPSAFILPPTISSRR